MKTKTKRNWSDEQRAAAAERARLRFTKKQVSVAVARREMAPEVQAVIDTMDPARRAKLERIQARNLAVLSQTKEGRDALERLEARHISPMEIATAKPGSVIAVPDLKHETIEAVQAVIVATRPMDTPFKVPFRLTGSVSGMMVSEFGNCVCGEPKLKWHSICLKVRV